MLAMLASVLALSRPPEGFQVLKMEGPKGELVPGTCENGLLWGIEPARSLERSADWVAAGSVDSVRPGEGDLKGL